MRPARLRRLGTLCASLGLAACAGLTPIGGSPEAGARARRAADALEREQFAEAREDLAWLAQQCAGGEQRRRALLLLAATDLDPASPSFSPPEAARAAAAYISASDTDEGELPVARALYRIAAEFGGFRSVTELSPTAGGNAVTPADCSDGGAGEDERPLPAMPAVGPTTHVRALEISAVASADSLAALKVQADSLRTELRRIAGLLTDGVAPQATPNGTPR